MIYFCANSPFDLYRSISFCDIGFMSYMFISRTFAFLLPLKIPHIPQTIYISLFFAATVIFESEVKVKVSQSCLTLCDPMDYTVHGILQARILKWVVFPFSKGSSQPRDWTQVSHIAGKFFTCWATRQAQEYWSGYLSFRQWIFPTHESNWGLLHCRGTLYQMSYDRSPIPILTRLKIHFFV